MAKRKLSIEDCDRIAELRENGASYGDLAVKFKVSPSAIRWHCLRLGAQPPQGTKFLPNYHLEHPKVKRGRFWVRAFTPAEDRQITELSLQGWTESRIGRELGRRHNSIRSRLMTLACRDERQGA
jgi:hypothetical protein